MLTLLYFSRTVTSYKYYDWNASTSDMCSVSVRLLIEICVIPFAFPILGSQANNVGPSLHYFLSMGHSLVYKWDGISPNSWRRVTDDETTRLLLDIPKETLLVGECVQELKGEGRGQR